MSFDYSGEVVRVRKKIVITGQVGNVITNRNANRLEFERLLDGAKTYMRHHKVCCFLAAIVYCHIVF